jgi:hypothetical protein
LKKLFESYAHLPVLLRQNKWQVQLIKFNPIKKVFQTFLGARCDDSLGTLGTWRLKWSK